MVIEFLGKYGSATKDDIDKLPDVLDEKQKQNKIRNLLYAMSKRDESIVNKGTNRKPEWKKNI